MKSDEAGGMPSDGGPVENTDRHLWTQVSDDYYAPRIHVTKEGNIGIDVGGHVFVKPLREWHELAKHASKPITKDEARKLLDEYYEARRAQVDCPEWTKPGELSKYRIAEKACIDAVTHAQTIAEQQREIERLRRALYKYGNHKAGCKEQSTMDKCTCGLDELLK